ncbi:hypothetical protein [Desulfosporosinus meridiei]|uniref:Uncharacterized protein n=1 Tax=Desulfosporosinus meridiei (strain ATCC BAA-275 / DSM 13257 / KCTC 12902 / NCIMB 13706 / S10) TaxID=768704 RepID=J7IVY4_DESMD|nr:hypothetical protein [Desulfosporosinus meridiei]AFQ45900.1 hypothetical protein Desmer_4069 [Desulfosporosinus meridiei DSM 13257]
MKKVISRIVPIALVSLLALPGVVQAKGLDDLAKMKNHGNKHYQSSQMNAKWSRFKVELQGNNEEGQVIKIIDNNPVFDYVLASGEDNGNLANGDTVVINVINRGGNIVKRLNYSIEGLEEVDEVDETKSLHLNTATRDLETTYGAVRFLNFNNQASGAEVYLTNAQEKLGTTNRTQIDFYRGTTTDDEKPIGDWEQRNKVRFGYDSDDGKVWVELNAEYEYLAEYNTLKDADFDAIQLMLLNRESDSVVKLENIKVNGKSLGDTVLIGNSSWPKWNLEGALQNSNGNFVVEADLVITGDQPKGELNKLEIVFGKK